MNQARVNQLAADVYHPQHKPLVWSDAVRAKALEIAKEEMQKPHASDDLQFTRGVRTRIHEHLQSLVQVPELPLVDVSAQIKMADLDRHLRDNHEHQTAHFQALWQHTDVLAEEAIAAAKGGAQ